MFRCMFSVVAGYVVMALFVMFSFGLAFVAPEFAFQKDACAVSGAFMVYGLLMSCVGAVAGGYVTAVLAGKAMRLSVKILAGFVLALGLALAVAGLFRPAPDVPVEEVAWMSSMERASKAVQPVWYAFLVPCLGGAGVLAGGALRDRRAARQAKDE